MKIQKITMTDKASEEITSSEQKNPDLIKTVVLVSPSGTMSREDWKSIGINFIKFSGPTLVLFFQLLANGVALEKAWPIAVLALYQSLSDLFSKFTDGPKK